MECPKVSIIIVNWNGKNDLIRCLESLRDSEYTNTELIVVDNGSTDGSLELLEKEFKEAQVVSLGKNVGRSEALNIGTKLSAGELVLHLDNDIRICDPALITKLVEKISSDSTIGVCGPMVLNMDSDIIQTMGAYVDLRSGTAIGAKGRNETDHGQFVEPFEVDYIVGCCIMFRRSILEKVGQYVSRYIVYYDETDLCLCVKKAGYRVVTDPRAKIMHRVSGSGSNMGDFSLFHFMKNRLLFMRRHGGFIDWLFFIPQFIIKPMPYVSRRFYARYPVRIAKIAAKAVWWNTKDVLSSPSVSENERLDPLTNEVAAK